jgi:hypothetical protein
VYPFVLDLSESDKSLPIVIVWKLLDRGYRFPDKDGGPTQPGTSADFTEGNTTDDDDGLSESGRPERKYRWKFTYPGTGTTYKYDIRFEVPDPMDSTKWHPVTCDPTIKSSAG